jgi:hypothetical protein
MTEHDKNILILFISLLVIFQIITIFIFTLFVKADLIIISGTFFTELIFIFTIIGVLAFIYNKEHGIISTKMILKWIVILSLTLAFCITIIVFTVVSIEGDIPNTIIELVIMAVAIYFGVFLGIFLSLIIFLFMSFGMIGLIVALVRAGTPEVLLHISRISSKKHISIERKKRKSTKESKKSKLEKMEFVDKIINWLFAIPDVLETNTLKINEGKPRKEFPWSNLYKALFWQLLFGTIIIIYISFNPLYVKSELDFQNLFNIATNLTLVVPFLILPWFIFLRLDAKIKGQVKDYELYLGIVYRMYKTFITLGTIIIIIRLGIERVPIEKIISVIPIYYFFFILTIFIVTFVYFNFFENELAENVAERYSQIKD